MQVHQVRSGAGRRTPAVLLGRIASGNHLTAQNDEPEPVETATQYAQRRSAENDRRALELQMSHPMTSGAL